MGSEVFDGKKRKVAANWYHKKTMIDVQGEPQTPDTPEEGVDEEQKESI